MSQNDEYAGREQSQVKHFILRQYLKRFARIIGSQWNTITYVDCFSGPWESKTADLSDTSFAIALQELRDAQTTLAQRKKSLNIRCLFLEEQAKRYSRLAKYCQKQSDVVIETQNASMLDAIPQIADFIERGGSNSFPFIFIDPTGWTGFDHDRLRPLLRQPQGEVLVNFMTEHIRRFVTSKEKRVDIIDSFRRLFGTDAVFDRVMLYASKSDTLPHVWKLCVKRVASFSRCLVGRSARHPSMASRNFWKSRWWRLFNTSFLTNFHRRSIRFRLGEYDGRNNNSIPNTLAVSVTNAHR